MRIAFRCDGDRHVGAGHVARSLQVAEAFARSRHEPVFIGHYAGLAAELLAAAGFATRPPGPGSAGVPPGAEAVIVDSYDIPEPELERLSKGMPVAAFCDNAQAPPVAAVLHCHLSPPGLPRLPRGTAGLIGPDYAPVSPRLTAARRDRGLARGLVAVGGSEPARAFLEPAVEALRSLGRVDVFVAGSGSAPDVGLVERIAWTDVAISAAGGTAYELVCAGVPTVAAVVADNQVRVATGLARAGAARGFDARAGNLAERLGAEVAPLSSHEERLRLAIAGPATVDGHGAARARDAFLAAFAGRPPPPILRYRPARAADAERLLAWRNDPDTREASREQGEIDPAGHRRWLDRVLRDSDRVLLIAEQDREPVGSLRFDRQGDRAVISVSIAAERRGCGLGTQAIRETTELFLAGHPDVRGILAEVRPENAASLRVFERAGYRLAPGSVRGMRVLEAALPVSS